MELTNDGDDFALSSDCIHVSFHRRLRILQKVGKHRRKRGRAISFVPSPTLLPPFGPSSVSRSSPHPADRDTSTHPENDTCERQGESIVSHLPYIPDDVVMLERLTARSAFEDGVKNDGGELARGKGVARDGRARRRSRRSGGGSGRWARWGEQGKHTSGEGGMDGTRWSEARRREGERRGELAGNGGRSY